MTLPKTVIPKFETDNIYLTYVEGYYISFDHEFCDIKLCVKSSR